MEEDIIGIAKKDMEKGDVIRINLSDYSSDEIKLNENGKKYIQKLFYKNMLK